LRNEDKNNGENKNETRQMTQIHKYSRPKHPGNSNFEGRKVSWAYRTKRLDGSENWKIIGIIV